MHLIIADHTLKDYQGHSFEYCKSVREIAIAKGWKVTTLGTSLLEPAVEKELKALKFLPMVFSTISHSIPSFINSLEDSKNFYAPAGIIANIVNHYFTIFVNFFQIATTLNPYLFFSPHSALTTSQASHDLQKSYRHHRIRKSQWSNISPPDLTLTKTASPTGFTNIHCIIYQKLC